LVDTFPGFLLNSFEKQQVASCRPSKEICANSRNLSACRKRGIALCCLQKSFLNLKAFGVKRLRTYLIQNEVKGRVKNNDELAVHIFIKVYSTIPSLAMLKSCHCSFNLCRNTLRIASRGCGRHFGQCINNMLGKAMKND
jgi:hypothetical protein